MYVRENNDLPIIFKLYSRRFLARFPQRRRIPRARRRVKFLDGPKMNGEDEGNLLAGSRRTIPEVQTSCHRKLSLTPATGSERIPGISARCMSARRRFWVDVPEKPAKLNRSPPPPVPCPPYPCFPPSLPSPLSSLRRLLCLSMKNYSSTRRSARDRRETRTK